MNKTQLLKQLHSINKQLVLCSNKMYRISEKLNIPENEDIQKVISDIEELIRIGEESGTDKKI